MRRHLENLPDAHFWICSLTGSKWLTSGITSTLMTSSKRLARAERILPRKLAAARSPERFLAASSEAARAQRSVQLRAREPEAEGKRRARSLTSNCLLKKS